jgi:hypothetical protein
VSTKVPCKACGAEVLQATIDRTDGLCMPCAKIVENPPRALPSFPAFSIAAMLLALNALITSFLLLRSGTLQISVLSVVVDAVLAILLLKMNEGARLLTLIRATLGLFLALGTAFLLRSPQSPIDAIVVQSLFSAGLIVLLYGETTKLKILFGSFCLAMLTVYHVASVWLILKGGVDA